MYPLWYTPRASDYMPFIHFVLKKDPVFKITLHFLTKYLFRYFTDKMICDQPISQELV